MKTQLCLLNFHIPQQTEEVIVSKRNQNLGDIKSVSISSIINVVLKRREVLDENQSFGNESDGNFMVLVNAVAWRFR